MSTYTDYQAETSSEKIVLAIINAKKRLMAWEVYSGSVYKLENQVFDKIVSIEDSGSAYTKVSDITSISAGKWFYDRVDETIYIQASDSSNPNSRFLVGTLSYYFSNVAIGLSHDLAGGYNVFWRPYIDKLSKFGAELDNQDQVGVAIEGSGSLRLINDQDFWQSRYDRLTWENQDVKIYSWTRSIPETEAKLIFNGKINGKSFSLKNITFKLKDLLLELRNPVSLANIADLTGEKVPEGLKKAKQRRVYGKVQGFEPTNIDQSVPDVGYQGTGTVSISTGSPSITGSGTSFYDEVSPDDNLILDGNSYTVESITNDTSLILSENYSGDTLSGDDFYIDGASSKKFANRVWQVTGHAINQPETTVDQAINQNRLILTDATDFNVGDEIYVGTIGSGEANIITNKGGNTIVLQTNLLTVPTSGTAVIRQAIQNVRIDSTRLVFDRDYSIDATNGVLTLEEDAEFNASSIRTLNGTITITNGSRSVTGSGTTFTKQLVPGQWITVKSKLVWYEISSIEDDTNLTLKTLAATAGAGSGVAGQYKALGPLNPEENILTCTVYGTTDDDTSTGALIQNGPMIVKHILEQESLGSTLNAASFTTASGQAPHLLGIAIPATYSDTSVPKIRDIINKINTSVLGSLVENEDFELEYRILQPFRPTTIQQYKEVDILKFSVDTEMDRVVSSVDIKYLRKEYDFEYRQQSTAIETKTSNVATYITGSVASKDIETYLVNQSDARIFASRWSFLYEYGSSVVKMQTKLKSARLQVGDPVEILHEKFYDRIGGGQQKISAINSIKKDGMSCDVETEDLANCFTRVCLIADADANTYSDASEQERFQSGYITDDYGLINNDEDTFGLNLLW